MPTTTIGGRARFMRGIPAWLGPIGRVRICRVRIFELRSRAALLGMTLVASLLAPMAATAQNLGATPQFGQAVQGQQATTVEGTILNIVNWGCNVIAPVVAVACLGIAAWHFKSGRGYFGWAVTGIALMAISGLGRLAEGFITQAQGIQ